VAAHGLPPPEQDPGTRFVEKQLAAVPADPGEPPVSSAAQACIEQQVPCIFAALHSFVQAARARVLLAGRMATLMMHTAAHPTPCLPVCCLVPLPQMILT
jgi:hypothetical protein